MRDGVRLILALVIASVGALLTTGSAFAHAGEDHAGSHGGSWFGPEWMGVAGVVAVAALTGWLLRHDDAPADPSRSIEESRENGREHVEANR